MLVWVALLILAVLSAPLAAEAQQTGKVYRVGILIGASREIGSAPRLLPKALRELGYIEGQTLTKALHQ